MAHIHEKIDFTVEVFIVYKNKVFLRKHDKYKLWLSIGGHIEMGEDPLEAAVREVKEEVGLDIELYSQEGPSRFNNEKYRELIPPQFMNRNRISDIHEHVTMVYFAKAKSDVLKLSETEKTLECRLFTEEELEDKQYDIREDIKFYAKSALKTLKD